MADNYLITGYHGEPHVTAENDRGINAGTFGAGRFVLPVGQQFHATYVGDNTIRLYDGKLMDNGAAAGIPVGESIDFLIANAGQGMNRNDLIVFQYSKDESTGVESGSFVVIQGTETSGTAEDPELTQEDLLTNKNAMFDQMVLWRVPVSSVTISEPVQMFTVAKSISELESGADAVIEQGTSGIWTYRKWESGLRECWGNVSKTINMTSTTTGLVVYSTAIRGTYPSGLFTEPPVCQATLNKIVSSDGDTHYNAWTYTREPSTATKTIGVSLLRLGSEISDVKVEVGFYAIGK